VVELTGPTTAHHSRTTGHPMTISGARPEAAVPAALRVAIDLARYAPSLHNSQPWAWRIVGDVAELSADPRRSVPIADPSGREAMLGCGAALHHARISLVAAGWGTYVTLLPDPARPELLARITLTGKRDPDQAAIRMAGAITRRHTDRHPFKGDALPVPTVAALRSAVEQEGCRLTVLSHENDQITLAVQSARAQRIQTDDPAYQAELAGWTGERRTADGVPPGQVPHLLQPRHSDVALRDFEQTTAGQLAVPPGVDERPGWAILYTDGDSRADQLRAGQAMSALLLTATDLGVAAGVQSQSVEVAPVRALIDGGLLHGLGHAQLMLSLGHPDPANPLPPVTPRRPLTDVLPTA
jgi:nitroreductase